MTAALFLSVVTASAKTDIIAFMPEDLQFKKVLEGMRSELDTNYHIEVVNVSKPFDIEAVARECKKNDVKALILMDAKAVNAVRELQNLDSSFSTIPKFVFMTLMVETTTKGLSNIAGIKFEVPVYTLVTNFKIISRNDFSKVGIFYRKSFAGSVEKAKRLLNKEQLSLETVCIDCEKNEKISSQDALAVMRKSFDTMVKQQGCEVFLVLADNLVVNNASLNDFWIEKVKKKKFPVIASLDMLASRRVALAVFAADPDLIQLGVQGADQIIEYFENGSSLSAIGFEPTISIKSTVNESVAKELGWKLNAEKLGRINQIIK
jgi:ABC-type uncharacterized transport system substrate-binding protein